MLDRTQFSSQLFMCWVDRFAFSAPHRAKFLLSWALPPWQNVQMSTDLTFVTNEPGNNLRDRFNTLLTSDTELFDCLVGYFYISGFHKIYPALGNVDKVRILVGLQTDRTAFELWQHARRDGELNLSHA